MARAMLASTAPRVGLNWRVAMRIVGWEGFGLAVFFVADGWCR